MTFVRYAMLRLARISPLHFATAMPFIVYAIYKNGTSALPFVALNLAYLHSWFPNSSIYFSFNAPSWSLSNEMFFYLCFYPLVMLSFKKLAYLALALSATILISAVLTYNFIEGATFSGNKTFSHWLFYIFPGFRLLEFLVGMLFYEIWKNGYRLSAASIPVAYMALFGAIWFASVIPEPFRMSLYFLPFISFLLYAHLSEGAPLNKIYGGRTMVLLGNASFAFYLIHVPIISILERLQNRLHLPDVIFVFLSLVIVTLASICTYLVYEKRVESYFKRLVNGKFASR